MFAAASQKRVGGPLQVLLLRASWPRAHLTGAPSSARSRRRDRIVCDGEQALLQSARRAGQAQRIAVSLWHVRKRDEDILVESTTFTRPTSAVSGAAHIDAVGRRLASLRAPSLGSSASPSSTVDHRDRGRCWVRSSTSERFTAPVQSSPVLRDVKKHLTLPARDVPARGTLESSIESAHVEAEWQ